MKIFSSEQIRKIDEFTIRNERIPSVHLMERAASRLFEWYIDRFPRSQRVVIFTGPGNNGGDGLALARMLAENRYEPLVCYLHFSENTSDDWKINRERLEKETNVPFTVIENTGQFPLTDKNDIIIDAIFGSGLSRPVTGLPAEIIKQINSKGNIVIAIDIPSGLFGEDNHNNNADSIIKADFTLSFQFPKLSFMFSENEIYTGQWFILPIGLDTRAIETILTPYIYIEKKDIAPLLKSRRKFDHKGIFGHGLFIGGSYGKMGAVVLGAKAALRTGAGLITCMIPSCGTAILQIAVPEAMVMADSVENYISGKIGTERFDAIGVGPGMGTQAESRDAIHDLLIRCKKPMVIDADALNIISDNKDWLSVLPENCILTPHPKEFERLAGKCDKGFERLQKQIEFSGKYKCIVVLKGAHTSVTFPDGKVWFNSTGNPGMATAGSGDVLTGILLSLLTQGYDPADAAVTGVFLHGMAGDIAAGSSCHEALLASDIINEISGAFRRIRDFE